MFIFKCWKHLKSPSQASFSAVSCARVHWRCFHKGLKHSHHHPFSSGRGIVTVTHSSVQTHSEKNKPKTPCLRPRGNNSPVAFVAAGSHRGTLSLCHHTSTLTEYNKNNNNKGANTGGRCESDPGQKTYVYFIQKTNFGCISTLRGLDAAPEQKSHSLATDSWELKPLISLDCGKTNIHFSSCWVTQ